MNETITVYRMNPAEDRICFGDELADGMWVLAEDPGARQPAGRSEDEEIRRQRFRRVTRLRRKPANDWVPEQTVFVGEWVDGYQELHSYALESAWIVKEGHHAAQDQ